MNDSQPNTKDRSLGLLICSVLFVVVFIVAAIVIYRYKFNGGLASSSSEWSNFGTYIGGVFGPLISFVTLLVVLKTVYMQRELLDTQKKEFVALSAKQDQELLLAKEEAERAKVQAYQSTILNVIESFSTEFKDEANALAIAAENASYKGLKVLEDINTSESYRVRANKARKKVSEFKVLMLELSVNEYKSIGEIKKKFAPELLRIMEIKV